MRLAVRILGTHGVPAAYGGFETAAEQVGLFLARRGWDVTVYCQVSGRGPTTVDTWNGLTRVNIPEHRDGWLGTSSFDLKSIRHAARSGEPCLTFGYNTGVFNTVQRLKRIPNVINMDGMEWTRARWGLMKQGILLANERWAGLVGTHLIADHPEIERYLTGWVSPERVSMITYGAHAVVSAPEQQVRALGLEPGCYLSMVCRPIPENSVLEIVQAFSTRPRGVQLVVLGTFTPGTDAYHREVVDAASDEVVFPGAIYEPETVQALRFHSLAYVHGHTVGGTNPSLVEAMAAGNPVIAHDNVYNRWTAGADQVYFRAADDLSALLDDLLDDEERLAGMARSARARHAEEFTWEHVAGEYERVLLSVMPGHVPDHQTEEIA